MIVIRRHNSHDYAILPDIDATGVGVVNGVDQECLNEIGGCLVRARLHARFGVTLLHSHFPVGDDETLLEEVQTDAQLISLRPVPKGVSDLFATNVCFEDGEQDSGEIKLVGLEFASSQTLGGVDPIDERDRNIFTEFGGILHRHGKVGRFCIRLIHDPLNLKGRVLLETCDSIHRVLTCRSSTEDDPAFDRSIPTVFQWEDVWVKSEDGLVVGQECIQMCKTVRRCTKSVHGSHDRSSSHEPTGHQSF